MVSCVVSYGDYWGSLFFHHDMNRGNERKAGVCPILGVSQSLGESRLSWGRAENGFKTFTRGGSWGQALGLGRCQLCGCCLSQMLLLTVEVTLCWSEPGDFWVQLLSLFFCSPKVWKQPETDCNKKHCSSGLIVNISLTASAYSHQGT